MYSGSTWKGVARIENFNHSKWVRKAIPGWCAQKKHLCIHWQVLTTIAIHMSNKDDSIYTPHSVIILSTVSQTKSDGFSAW